MKSATPYSHFMSLPFFSAPVPEFFSSCHAQHKVCSNMYIINGHEVTLSHGVCMAQVAPHSTTYMAAERGPTEKVEEVSAKVTDFTMNSTDEMDMNVTVKVTDFVVQAKDERKTDGNCEETQEHDNMNQASKHAKEYETKLAKMIMTPALPEIVYDGNLKNPVRAVLKKINSCDDDELTASNEKRSEISLGSNFTHTVGLHFAMMSLMGCPGSAHVVAMHSKNRASVLKHRDCLQWLESHTRVDLWIE